MFSRVESPKFKIIFYLNLRIVLYCRYSRFVFEYAIASVVPLIVSATVAERVRFECFLIFSALTSGLLQNSG